MHIDPRDKKPSLENELPLTAPEEGTLPADQDMDKERDLDDLVHSIATEEVNLNEEIDADDAVHTSKGKPVEATDNETDPDDRVHGN